MKVLKMLKARIARYWILELIILVSGVAVGYGFYFLAPTATPPEVVASEAKVASRPVLMALPVAFDFGDVSVRRGEVMTSFTLRNGGEADLVIKDMDTSCGCTEAAVFIDGSEGPRFNMRMHGKNPTNWSVILAPGEEAKLRVYYNPNTHPALRGDVTREVYLFGDDLRSPLSTVRIFVNQTG